MHPIDSFLISSGIESSYLALSLVLARIDTVLKLLPQAQKQAHERIIGERQVPNGEKILSLYDTAVRVIVRGKAGAEVEFGNSVSLAEKRAKGFAHRELGLAWGVLTHNLWMLARLRKPNADSNQSGHRFRF